MPFPPDCPPVERHRGSGRVSTARSVWTQRTRVDELNRLSSHSCQNCILLLFSKLNVLTLHHTEVTERSLAKNLEGNLFVFSES